jgi:hypothetical protein
MLKWIAMFAVLCCLWLPARAQKEASKALEAGITLGASVFFGDLGGTQQVGRGAFVDYDIGATRPVMGAYLRYNPNNRIGLRGNLYYTQVYGDDRFGGAVQPGQGGWPRKYRNLHFRSSVAELSAVVEINALPYVAGSTRFRFTPYALVGAGVFRFDPKAKYEGEWVRLQPLGTEGQGLPQYPAKQPYKLIAACFPVGVGIKLNMDNNWSFSLEFSHRHTTTDYLDDVSGFYADPAYFYQAHPPETADMIRYLADPSSGDNPAQTSPGQQRGDPSDFDSYAFAGLFSFTYVIKTRGNTQYYCPKFF